MFTHVSGRQPLFPWHEDSINIDVVRERRSHRHPQDDASKPFFKVQAGTRETAHRWSRLTPGRMYLVVADVFGSSLCSDELLWQKKIEAAFPIKAAAMVFQGYEPFPAGPDLDGRVAHCNFMIAEAREALQELEEEGDDDVDDDDTIDELLERISSWKVLRRACKWLLRFKSCDGSERFLLDLFHASVAEEPTAWEDSSYYFIKVLSFHGQMLSNDAAALQAARAARWAAAEADRRDAAALTIQRAFLKAYYDPGYAICDRRLAREHAGLVNE